MASAKITRRRFPIVLAIRAELTSGRWIEWLIGLILAVFSFVMFYPFIWLILSSFKEAPDILRIPVSLLPQKWTLSAYEMVLDPRRANLPRAYLNSIMVTVSVVVTVVFTSSLCGYAFARLRFPGRQILFYLILSTAMVPFITLLIPLYIVVKYLTLMDTLWALWVPSIFNSFGIFLCRQFIYGIPVELYDAAKMDGAGDFGIYHHIIVHLIKPVMSALAIFEFLGVFNSFLWPLVVLNTEDRLTLPLIIRRMADRFGGTDYQAIMAGSVLVSIPPLIVFLIFQRNFVKGIALTGLKG